MLDLGGREAARQLDDDAPVAIALLRLPVLAVHVSSLDRSSPLRAPYLGSPKVAGRSGGVKPRRRSRVRRPRAAAGRSLIGGFGLIDRVGSVVASNHGGVGW